MQRNIFLLSVWTLTCFNLGSQSISHPAVHTSGQLLGNWFFLRSHGQAWHILRGLKNKHGDGKTQGFKMANKPRGDITTAHDVFRLYFYVESCCVLEGEVNVLRFNLTRKIINSSFSTWVQRWTQQEIQLKSRRISTLAGQNRKPSEAKHEHRKLCRTGDDQYTFW